MLARACIVTSSGVCWNYKSCLWTASDICWCVMELQITVMDCQRHLLVHHGTTSFRYAYSDICRYFPELRVYWHLPVLSGTTCYRCAQGDICWYFLELQIMRVLRMFSWHHL